MNRLLMIVILGTALRGAAQAPFTAPGVKEEFKEIQPSSLYVPMRDGVRIAIDLLLPKGLQANQKVPALFKIARFGRASTDGSIAAEDRFWVQHGFARVLIDERGTGASFGTSRYGTDTIPDLYDVVDWVVKQSWCNGRVGAIGISVEGTAAELLAATNHPAVRAVAPWFSDYNYYTDLVRPGGIFNEWILKNFEDFTLQMDAGASAKHVDSDPEGVLLKQAVAEHSRNLNIYSATKEAPFVDDPIMATGKSLLDISIPGATDALAKSRVPMLVLASWYDAGTVQGTIKRFQMFSNAQKVFLGAWSHGANSNADPFLGSGTVQPSRRQQWLEALKFFNHYLKDTPKDFDSSRAFFYYTIEKNEWRSTDAWPPAGLGQRTYYLGANRTLTPSRSGNHAHIRLQMATTGDNNRWHTQLGGGLVDYSAALKQMVRLGSFTTVPLAAPLEITGQPVLRLQLACSQDDPSIIAYLIALNRTGKAFYITEGHLRLLHRKLNAAEPTLHTYARQDSEAVAKTDAMEADLTLLPTSVLLPKGTRLRLLLASGDSSTFNTSGEFDMNIFSSSSLELPVR